MKSVLIVNHKPENINYLTTLVDWSKYEYRIAGTCSDGTSAYEFILRKQPDMVFIEAELQGISGLDVIERIHDHGLLTEFVVTGEKGIFEYAQRAMRMGVQEYLIDPVSEDDLVRILGKYYQDASNEHNKDVENYIFSTRRLLRNSFMRNYVSAEDHQKYSIDALNRYYHFNFKEGIFQVALIQLRNLPKDEESTFLPAVVSELRARFDPVCNEMIPLIQGASRLTLLFNYGENSIASKRIPEIRTVIEEFLKRRNCIYTSYSIGIGHPSHKADDLLNLLHTAERAAYCGTLRGSNQMFVFDQLTFDSVKVEDVITQEFLGELEIGVESMDFMRYETAIHNAFKRVTPQTDPEVVVMICRSAIMEVAKSCGDSDAVTREEIRKVLYKVMNASSVSIIISALMDNAHSKLENAKKEREFSRPIREATKYIRKNFTKDLTLQDVADHVHLNASYLSMLFKKETGTNYIGFLTECRIDEAKRLLKDSSLSVAEICYAVGYTDKKHFSRLFIKRVGVRPTAYRTLH